MGELEFVESYSWSTTKRFQRRRVVETLAWSSHSWTLAISESCNRALVAVVARSKYMHNPITSPLMPLSASYLETMLKYAGEASHQR